MSNDSEEYQYLNLITEILKKGCEKNDRTKTGTISIFGTQTRYSLRNGVIPLLTTKWMFWSGIVEELLWFIRGSTNSMELTSLGVKIWDKYSTRGFLDRAGFSDRKEGDLGPIYGFQWRHFGAEYVDMNTNYEKCGIDQLEYVINTIRSNPNDRRLILCSWNPKDLQSMSLPPCHCLVQFYVSNGELSCQVYQRSGDIGLGVPFNIASYSLLTHLIAHITNLNCGELIHVIGDAHIYVDHIEPLKEQVKRKPRKFPKLVIKRIVKEIDNFTKDDFQLLEYTPYPSIYLPMSI